MPSSRSSSSSTEQGSDHARGVNKRSSYSISDAIFTIITTILYISDVTTDLLLAFWFLNQSHYFWFGLTLAFVLVPSVLNSLLGLYVCYEDFEYSNRFISIICIVLTILQLGPVVRKIESIIYGLKSMCSYGNSEVDYEDIKFFISAMTLIEGFLESAPQLTLQLYIMVVDPTTEAGPLKIVTLLTSWIAIGWSLTSFERDLRSSEEDNKLKIGASVVYFLWRVFEIGPRIIIISMFMSEYRYWVVVPLSLHWILVFIWFQTHELEFFDSTIGQTTLKVICAFITIFCFFDLQERKSRYRYMLFYGIFYVENIVLFSLWFLSTSHMGTWYRMVVLSLVLCGVILHAIFFGCYYGCCHPKRRSTVDQIPSANEIRGYNITTMTNHM